MATVPAPQTWSDTTSGGATVVGATALNREVRDAMNFMLNPPRAWIMLSVNQSIADSTFTSIGFDVEFEDSDNMVNPAYPDRITIQTPGRYRINWGIRFGSSAAGTKRGGQLVKNGSLLKQTLVPIASGQQTSIQEVTYASLVANDVLTMTAWQNTGGSAVVSGATAGGATPGEYVTFMQVRFLGT